MDLFNAYQDIVLCLSPHTMSHLVDISEISIFKENQNKTANNTAQSNGFACFAKEVKWIPWMVIEIGVIYAKAPKLDRRTDRYTDPLE